MGQSTSHKTKHNTTKTFCAGFHSSLLFLGELLVFLGYKCVRRDLRYWLPLEGIVGLIVSILMRLISKVIADFTMSSANRHAFELGGFYWLFNVFSTYGALLCAIYGVRAAEERVVEVDLDMVSYLGVGLIGLSWTSIVCMLWLMEEKYRQTFWSTKTARDFMKETFFTGKDDAVKSFVFMGHASLYKEFVGEVKEWTIENWQRWNVELPGWFKANVYTKIPIEWIGSVSEGVRGELEEFEKENLGRISSTRKRRRSSIASAVELVKELVMIDEAPKHHFAAT